MNFGQFIKRWKTKIVKDIVKKYFKLWNVEILAPEIVPPEFYITDHAHQRMRERLGCCETKIKKVAIKSWYSTEKLDKHWLGMKNYYAKEPRIHYRRFMGYTFVWQVVYKNQLPQKKLITMY